MSEERGPARGPDPVANERIVPTWTVVDRTAQRVTVGVGAWRCAFAIDLEPTRGDLRVIAEAVAHIADLPDTQAVMAVLEATVTPDIRALRTRRSAA